MKSKHLLLTLLMALLVPWAAQAQQCEISYNLTDSYGDGWNGGSMVVTDATTSTQLASLTISTGSSLVGTIPVTSGHEITFSYTAGSYADENSWVFTDIAGTTIWEGSGDGGSQSYTYTAECPSCLPPSDITVTLTPGQGTIATFSWSSDATAWQICFNNDESNLFNVNRPSFTYNGFTPETQYTVKVRTNCDGQYSSWSSPVTFTPTNAYQITVNDGTTTNEYVPIYGYYVDSNTKSQFIIPANVLDNMAYGTITQLTFYASQSLINWGNATFEVYMSETAETTVSTLVDWSTMTKVRNAASLSIVNNMMVVVFDTPYEYQGGNLMIGFNQPTTGTFVRSNWYGVSATGASIGGYGSNVSQKNFLPKTTFNYVPAAASDCERPDDLLALDEPTAHEFSFNIEGGSGVYNIELKAGSDDWETYALGIEATTINLTNLESNTAYQVRVQSVCDDNTSGWKTLSFTTPIACPVPTQVTVSDITPYSAVVSWTSEAESFNLKLDETVIERCTSPYTLSNLTPETSYTVEVQAVCSDIDQSQWTSTSFMTAEICPEGMVCIGTGTSTSNYMPLNNYYKYSLTEQIYTADEIGEAGAILSIDFYKAATVEAVKVLDIYIVSTTKDEFTSTSDWIPVTASDLVYSGTVTFADNAWTTIELDSPFIYDGVSNICIVVDNNTGSYVSNTAFRIFNASNNQTLYYQSDSSNPNPMGTIPSASDITGQKNRIRLNIGEPPACPKPTGVTASDVTAHEATITWTSDASAWQIQLGEENAINVTEPTYTFTGLAPETPYSVKVRTNCDGDYSDWTTAVNFTTGIACPAPTVAVSNITAYTAEVNCTNTDAEYFNVMLGENVVAENVTMPYTLTDLTDNTSYTVKVKAICGGEDGESQWSNGTSFMTAEICPEGMVCIGTGTNANQSVPTYTYYNYSLTQQIYTAAEIGQSGEITSVDFYKSGTNGGARTLDIYMVSTDKETFSGATDWIAVTASDLVYSGSVTFQNDAWTTIEFNTSFLYDGTTNIALIVDDNTGSYVFSAPSFYAFNATSQAIRIYSDATNYDATAPSSYSGTVLTQKNRVRFAISEPPACPKPTGLAVNYTGGITATVTWEGDATSYNIDVNGTVTEGVTSPYTLEDLELATTYNVMVQAVCSVEELSEWTAPVSFTTDLCMPENQCQITITLTDAYGDGGGEIVVIDNATEEVLGTYTNLGASTTYTLNVCEGRELSFVFNSTDNWSHENGWVITDVNDEIISEHEGCRSSGSCEAPTEGVIATYTVNCTVITCKKPKDLAAFDINKTSVVLSWTPGTEDQNAWRICYNDGEEDHFKNVTTIPYTLNGLTPETTYTVKVRANCGGGDYSNWSDEISFTTAEACPADIYNFSAYNITVHNALLSWTGEFNSYQVRYKKWIGETEWSDAIPTNEAAFALSGLEAGTEYEYQVQGYCSDVDAYSEWVDGENFTTQGICGAPQNLYAVPGINSATISWTGYQESYTVACGDTVETVYGTTYTLEGLESSTEYIVTVTGVGTECGEYQSATLEFATGAGWNDPNAWADSVTISPNTVVVIEPGEGPTEIPEDITVGDSSYIVIEPGAEVIYGGVNPIPVVLGSDDDDDDGNDMGPRCRDELPGGYRLIAPPVFNSLIEPFVSVVSTHLMDLPDDYFVNDLYSFDVNYPAQEWRNYKELANIFVNFNWKQGYLFYGYYPKVNWQGHIVANTNNSVEIALNYNEDHTYFPGANLIGNPFWAKGYPDMNFYVLNTAGNEVIPATNNYVGKAKGFFVLAEGPDDTCTVYTEAPDTLRSLNIALSQDCSLIDAAAIRFNDTKGLAKIQLNPNHTKIYMPFEGKDYAILQGEGLGEMPLNFEAEENGTYTLSFTSKEVNFSYLHLIDNLTGVETNLLANPSYSFEAKTTDYASRFRLVYATGSSVNGDNFGFINSMGNLSIYGIEGVATLQVMDVTGRILSTETFSGSYERKLNVAPGVYMLRLINGNDVKVQKMVIR